MNFKDDIKPHLDMDLRFYFDTEKYYKKALAPHGVTFKQFADAFEWPCTKAFTNPSEVEPLNLYGQTYVLYEDCDDKDRLFIQVTLEYIQLLTKVIEELVPDPLDSISEPIHSHRLI